MRRSHLSAPLLILALTTILPVTIAIPPRIVDPRYSVPVAVLVGGIFNATLIGVNVQSVEGAWISAPGLNYSLEVVSNFTVENGVLRVVLRVPEAAIPELYDLYINVGGQVLWEPRSVWVLSKWPEKLVLMHITDIHVDIVTDNVHSTTYFETAINLLNSLPVTLLVITGDCVDVGSDLSALKMFSEIVNRARKPTFIIPGNHDHAQTDEKGFAEKFYGYHVGPPYWYRVIGNFLIVGLDTGLDGYLDSQQLKWLENVLSDHPDKVKVLLIHHPIFDYGVFGEIQGSWKNLEELERAMYASWREHSDSAKEFLRLIEEYGVHLVLAGHVHGDSLVLYNGRTWFTTTTTTCAGVRMGDYRGFRILEIGLEGVEVWGMPGTDPLKEFSSYNIEKAYAITIQDSQLKANTAIIKLNRGIGLEIQNFTLYLYINASESLENYKIFGDTDLVEEYEVLRYTPNLHVAKLLLTPAQGRAIKLTVACYEDLEPPHVKVALYSPRRPVAGKDRVLVYVKASDRGWGIDKVELMYSTKNIEKSIEAFRVGADTYQAVIPSLNVSEVRVIAKATDLAGNVGESDEVTIEYARPAKKKPVEEKPEEEEKPSEEEAEAPQVTLTPLPLLVASAVVAVALVIFVIVIIRQRR